MKTVKYYLQVSIAALTAAIACPSCNDTWDDHYDVQDNLASGMAGASLWENLQTDNELKPFNRVLEACGYDVVLNSPQMYTVWAPVITEEEADEWIRIYNADVALGRTGEQNTAIKEFVMNHLALYNHQISSNTSDTVMMRNGKYMALTPSTINQTVDITDVRIPSSNGMLYKIDGLLPYYYNIWEAIQADSVGVHALDSVAHFLNRFEEAELDPVASVPGTLDSDGNQHYVDSVMIRQNTFFSDASPIIGWNRRAYIDSEDSLYYFLAPTNQVWEQKVEEYKKYFICAHNATAASKLDAYRDSIQDLYAKTALIESCFFNVRRQNDPSMSDSICSTIWGGSNVKDYNGAYKFDKPFSGEGIFDGASYVQGSNGRLYKTDDWKIEPTKTFIQPIKVEAESSYSEYNDSKVLVSVESQNNDKFKVSNGKYAVISAIGKTGNYYQPEIKINIPNTLSNCPYDIKIVFATRLANDSLSADTKNRQVTFKLNYLSETQDVLSTNPDDYYTSTVYPDGTKMDTVVVTEGTGPFIPKVCNFITDSEETVQITLSMRLRNDAVYSLNMAVDCIIFEPRLNEEEENN